MLCEVRCDVECDLMWSVIHSKRCQHTSHHVSGPTWKHINRLTRLPTQYHMLSILRPRQSHIHQPIGVLCRTKVHNAPPDGFVLPKSHPLRLVNCEAIAQFQGEVCSSERFLANGKGAVSWKDRHKLGVVRQWQQCWSRILSELN